ncbi:MAG: transglutaminase family protein [Abitibacteriaceae bacterium]|nr:transglutaminase family protein [Abditibacteriaceae bacterium]MBV9866887.1 transglutaminase family protein [Abditibacteriaceae bacterium]
MPTCHTTKEISITYSTPVRDCIRYLRIFPPTQRGSQRILAKQWRCTPEPSAVKEYADEFGNHILELHHAQVDRTFHLSLDLMTTRECCTAKREEGLPETGLGAFLLPSSLCDLSDAICHQARQLCKTGAKRPEDIETNLAEICAWTHQALVYTPGVTGTDTTASQVLRRGVGVCQDYAHLMIALCRAVSIPARYVSGYNPAEGLMHAWVEVLYEDIWHAWDPTHNRPTSARCVFVACGRDFRDVEPLSGSYRGCSTAQLSVHCHTQVLNKAGTANGPTTFNRGLAT